MYAMPARSSSMGSSGSNRASPDSDSHRLKTTSGANAPIADIAPIRSSSMPSTSTTKPARASAATTSCGGAADVLARSVLGILLAVLEVAVVNDEDARLVSVFHA